MKTPVFADYHTHTCYSHGTGSVEDNVLSAIDRGLEILAIADHGPKQLAHGVSARAFLRQIEEIAQLKQKYAGQIEILAAIEANITGLDGSIDLLPALQGKFDLVLAGYHRTAVPNRLRDLFSLQIPALLHLKSASKHLTRSDELALSNCRIFMITHPGAYVPVDIARIARAANAAGAFIEINNKHPMRKEEIQTALSSGASFILSSDAHTPDAVGEVSRALDAALDAGVPKERILNLRKEI